MHAPQIIAASTKQMMTDFALGSQALPVASRLAAAEEMELAKLSGFVLAKSWESAEPLVEQSLHQPRFRREVVLVSCYMNATRGVSCAAHCCQPPPSAW